MLEIFRTSGFKSDFKKLNDDDKEKFKAILTTLVNGLEQSGLLKKL